MRNAPMRSDWLQLPITELINASSVRRANPLCGGYNYDSTSIRRPFDCLSKVIKITVT